MQLVQLFSAQELQRYHSMTRTAQPLNEVFDVKKVFTSFAGLPQVAHLVWSASPPLTASMAFFTIIGGITPLANAIIARLLLDSVILGLAHHTFTVVWFPVLALVGVNLLDRVCSLFNTLLQTLLQERVAEHIQLLILHKANTLDLAFFENPEFYDKMSTAREDALHKPMLMISQNFNLIRAFVTLFSMIGLLFHLAWWLVPIAVLTPLPSFLANSRYSLKGYWQMRWQSPEKRQQLYISQIMTTDDYCKEIKLFNLGNYFIQRYRELSKKFYQQNKNLQVPRNLTNLLWVTFSTLTNGGVYLYVAYQAILGSISIGALSQYTIAINQVGQSIQAVLDGITNQYENHLFVQTVFEFLAYQPVIASPKWPTPLDLPSQRKGLTIEFRNVSFTYPDKQQPTLHNMSFSVCSGETIALVGSNGAGKTTLVKLLTRLYDCDQGEILINGCNIKEYDLQSLREQIGVIFQDYVKYALKAQENIGVGHVSDIENLDIIARAASRSGADAVINKLDDGYATMLGKWFDKGTQLSGGEWQKIAIARALMRDARIMVMDEPTSALDAPSEYDLFARFLPLIKGITTLFISHRFSTVRLADRILVIEHGAIVESGSHDELMQKDGRYATLFNLQAQAYR